MNVAPQNKCSEKTLNIKRRANCSKEAEQNFFFFFFPLLFPLNSVPVYKIFIRRYC